MMRYHEAAAQIAADAERREQQYTALEGAPPRPPDTGTWTPLRFMGGKIAPPPKNLTDGDPHEVIADADVRHPLYTVAHVRQSGRYVVADQTDIMIRGTDRQYHFVRGVVTMVDPRDVQEVMSDPRHEFQSEAVAHGNH